jgi:hypothetical protein
MWRWRVDVVGDDVLARVDASDDSGKRNPPVRRPTRDLADLWIFKVRENCSSPSYGKT